MKIDSARHVFDDFRSRFAKLVAVAEAIDAPNIEDTSAVKCAMAGFGQHSSLGNWTRDHFVFVRDRLAEGDSGHSEDVANLYAMCLGGICALAFERDLSEVEFQIADMQLVGLIFALGDEL